MFIDYRQEVVRKIALCITPAAKFSMDAGNNILIPTDEESCRALLVANNIVDKLHEILDFNVTELTEIYKHLATKYNGIPLQNIAQFLDLLKIIGASQANVK